MKKNNETFVTNIIISIYAELAQEERMLLSECTKSGLVAARKKEARCLTGQKEKKSIMYF